MKTDIHCFMDKIYSKYKNVELAKKLNVSAKTISRWKSGESRPPYYIIPALQYMLKISDKPSSHGDFRFIDLFAGIGGIRLGFELNGGKCVFTSEWDKHCQKTYLENFGNDHLLIGDITLYNPKEIPDHDVLLAGFPYQPFNIAGVSKKKSLGRPHGFEDKTQGTLFFNVAQILKIKKPAAFLLENVKNLISHDKGNTFRIIQDVLTNELGYHIQWKVIDARYFVPQHRERIIIVGFKNKVNFDINNLSFSSSPKRVKDILHTRHDLKFDEGKYVKNDGTVHDKYILSEKLWTYLQQYAEKHKAKGNGFGYGIVKENDITRTLSARYYKDGSEILIHRGQNKRPRRLTPRECARLMGYPDNFLIPVSDTQAYRQFGNSVVVPVIDVVARQMRPFILEILNSKKCSLRVKF